jgi:hypothetical protein
VGCVGEVKMEATVTLAEEKLPCFLAKHGNNQARRGLLLFWSRYPSAKFNKPVIYSAVTYPKSDVEKALKDMVEEGIVVSSIQNKVTLYSLTPNEGKRRAIMELSTLDFERQQLLFRSIEQRESSAHSINVNSR